MTNILAVGTDGGGADLLVSIGGMAAGVTDRPDRARREQHMAFVNEKVSDDDKGNVLFTRNNPFPPYTDKKLRPSTWTIDRERDFILMGVLHNIPDMWDCFVFQWKGELGALMTVPTGTQEPSTTTPQGFVLDVTWTMRVLHVPIPFAERAEEIKSLLTEAFEAYGRWGGVGPMRSTRVIWDDCGVIVGGGYVTL